MGPHVAFGGDMEQMSLSFVLLGVTCVFFAKSFACLGKGLLCCHPSLFKTLRLCPI